MIRKNQYETNGGRTEKVLISFQQNHDWLALQNEVTKWMAESAACQEKNRSKNGVAEVLEKF